MNYARRFTPGRLNVGTRNEDGTGGAIVEGYAYRRRSLPDPDVSKVWIKDLPILD